MAIRIPWIPRSRWVYPRPISSGSHSFLGPSDPGKKPSPVDNWFDSWCIIKSMKMGLIILLVVLIAGGIYYTGLYTYFTKTEVNEEMPIVVDKESSISGEFREIDIIHKGSGMASLVKGSQEIILRFENFKVTSGPDLYVYLTNTIEPTGDIESLGEFIDLGRLKGNIGNQNYIVDGYREGYNTVVIWCKKYEVLFSFAVMN